VLDVLYLASNIGDATVAKRLQMLRDGGASVSVAGFRRAGSATPDLGPGDHVVLGETFDARFLQRILALARASGPLNGRMRGRARPDVILARNLEMLFLAGRLRSAWAEPPAIVYECLDIHRLLLRADMIGRSLRGIERSLLREADLLITSSLAFVREYFEAHGQADLPVVVLENKVYPAPLARGRNPALVPSAGPPLRIGWFGALRCRKSLEALSALAERSNGKVEVVLRGRPALTEFDDFHGTVAGQRFLSYGGPYAPRDVPDLYSGVHLAWAIDYFEEGQNSAWLLPNRIYEGGLNGAIPIALAGTETAAFIERLGIGIVVPDIAPQTLLDAIGALDAAAVRQLAEAVAALPATTFAAGTGDAQALVSHLGEVAGVGSHPLEEAA
jgi:succinoglycan biosynthesis protein ExoL